MFITRTVTKKILENIVQETFSNFGNLQSSALLDSLKLLGFYYATTAGISINIEDLKTPDVKKDFLKIANEEMLVVSQQWQQGFVSDTERFQSIIDSWNIATESLKNRIIDYYQNFDPANNLYIMAFSGARGNMSQVRQLVGMRGLMSDQEGKIIDLPIQTNFREGLSSIDYIISSYGARKGIVDTALKTADSGYLTRRLIYLAQDLIIREIDCNTKSGVIILLNNKNNIKNIVGRTLISASTIKGISLDFKNILLTEKIIQNLRNFSPLSLNIRSSLTCQTNGSICQKCYGWDLAHKKFISLGEAVGIIAAQSIGEPGTQLTMRTFHTGGIFTSEMLSQTLAPFSGKIIIPKSLKIVPYRTTHGLIVFKLQQETLITIVNWKGLKKEIFLEIGSFLYINSSSFVKKGQLISEASTKSFIPGARRLKPIYTPITGEIKYENLQVRYIFRENKSKVKVNQDDGILWLASGKIFSLPKEIKYKELKYLNKQKPFANLKLITPYEGFINISDQKIILTTSKQKFSFDLNNLMKNFKNCLSKFSFIVKNYQYVDQQTILGYLYLFPNFDGKIYSIRTKESKFIKTFFFITESDIWKINSDQVNNFDLFPKKKTMIRNQTIFSKNSQFTQSGIFLKKDGFKMIFQTAIPIFLSRGTILNYRSGDLVLEKQVLATLVNYTQQTEDIVQGLPKIEELIEARIPKIKAHLSSRPGIFLNPSSSRKLLFSNIEKNIILCGYKQSENNKKIQDLKIKKPKKQKQVINIIHSIYSKNQIVFYDKKIWKISPVSPDFKPFPKKTKVEFYFKNTQEQILLINGKVISSSWILKETFDSLIYKYVDEKLIPFLKINSNEIFENKRGDYIVKNEKGKYLFLESLDPVTEYKLGLSMKVLLKPGTFVDIGEPITEGVIDPHELLNLLFKYHYILDGTLNGTLRSLAKFQLLLVNSIQSIYQSQGVNISSKHIEIIVRQMTTKVVIKERGDTPLLSGELIRLSLVTEIFKSLKANQKIKKYKAMKYEPLFLSTTNSSLSKDGFLSAAGFQETKRVLTKASIEGTCDWLRGLKECVIIGRLIPAGSAFLNYKNYLDNIYLFKD